MASNIACTDVRYQLPQHKLPILKHMFSSMLDYDRGAWRLNRLLRLETTENENFVGRIERRIGGPNNQRPHSNLRENVSEYSSAVQGS